MVRTGRPKSTEPKRDSVVPVRFTADEHAEVSAAADAAGLPLSAYVRGRVLASARRARKRGPES
ncbi:hypothetical protein DK926_22810 [Rhodococcus sp. Eu-32]|uniref:plasmid mobilization protein n=1 Tax=Rhodococcus sp. Eu-32 TaxID=1017319 RepID=UPI000DF37D0D|nr:hypothetical protein [Rhodococcus sp. Eu-32]RRQ25596.1 hypothetical protein DK926_22810 [Rhodococcus sp. Eu-32]